MSGNPTMVKR